MLKFISVMCTLFVAAVAGADEHACSELFYSHPFYNNREFVKNRPTVKILGLARNGRGEEFFRYRKLLEEQNTFSFYGKHSFEPQGDPYRIIGIIGYDLARVIGFSWNAKGDKFAPVPVTLNARIATFNRYLVSQGIEPIPINFYPQRHATIESFMRFWSEYLGIPVAAGQTTHTLHDIAFHYGAVLLPPSVVRMIQVQAAAGVTLWTMLGLRKITARTPPAMIMAGQIDSLSTSANVNLIARDERASHIETSIFYNFVMTDVVTETAEARRADHPASDHSLFDYLEEYLYLYRHSAAYLELRNSSNSADEVRQKIRAKRRSGDWADVILKKLSKEQPLLHRTAAEWGFRSSEDALNLFENRTNELQAAARRFLLLHPQPAAPR